MLGPQRLPITPARLIAQWRQIDTEHKEALAVRAEWMTLMGYSEAQIAIDAQDAVDLCLEDELQKLTLTVHNDRRDNATPCS